MVDEDVVERGDGRVLVHRDGHALAGGEPVRLDDDRRAMLMHIVDRRHELVECPVRGRRNVVARHELLREVLRPLDLRGGLARAERLDARFGERVDDAVDERHLGADEHPVIVVVAHKIDERGLIRRRELQCADALAEFHARVAGRDRDLFDAAAAQQRVGDRMFARAGTDDQNLHVSSFSLLR